MNTPAILREELSLVFKAGMCIPELSLQHESAWRRRATRILYYARVFT